MFILDSAVTFFTAVNIEATKYSADTSLGWVSKKHVKNWETVLCAVDSAALLVIW